MKILLIGCGSIGKRHLRNLFTIGYKDIAIVSNGSCDEKEFQHCEIYSTTEAALRNNKFDAAFICTPTALHVKDLMFLLKNRITHIYVEKPLSNSNESLDDVLGLVYSTSANVVVGYDLHFDPGFQKVKELIDKKVIGKIVSANVFVGQHLSQWRPHKDYREGMSAKKETGGGVMLDLIHEIDYLYTLFGDVESVASIYVNSGALEIETEDVAEILLKFNEDVIATVHLDYLQANLNRFGIFTGINGTIHWNLAEQKVTTTFHNKQEEFSYASFQRNDRFIAIIKTFLESPNDERLTRLPDAIKSLQIVLAGKYAGEHNCVVDIGKWIVVNGEKITTN